MADRVSVSVGPDPLRPEELRARVSGEASGAVVLFVGTVRRENRGREVASLAYEAYDEMAVEELDRVCREGIERFGVDRIGAAHRTGRLDPGEASVVIAVAGGHRGPTFDAARWVMDELKHRVPLWKKERYVDGEERWLEGRVPEGGEPD